MKQYEKYKDSKIAWLGEIPEHWCLAPIKHLFSFTTGFTPPTNRQDYYDGDLDWVTIADMNQKFISESKNKITNKAVEELGKIPIPKGSLMYSFKLSVGKVGFADKELYTNEAIFSVLPKEGLDLEYYYYTLQDILIHNSNENIYGAKLLNQELILNSFMPKIPFVEQRAIARYLDYTVGKVDKLIEAKTGLVEKLQAQRKVLINEVVTRGLDLNAPMRPSGIEWLGDIPEHWEIGKLKYYSSKIGSGITPTGGAEVYQSEGILFIRSQNVYSDGLRVDEIAYISEEIDAMMSNSRVANNDVLLNITGASIGRCCYVKGIDRANVNQHVCIIRPVEESLICEYLQLILSSDIGQIQIALAQNGGNREGLNFENLKNFIIPDISLIEQKEIVTFIEERTTKIDNLVSELQKQIARLRDYKTSLISEAVTGKIDLREWQEPQN